MAMALNLNSFNDFLKDKSYIEGYQASQADAVVYQAIDAKLIEAKMVYLARWYKHISSFSNQFAT
jgi:elongation factor 1-beta